MKKKALHLFLPVLLLGTVFLFYSSSSSSDEYNRWGGYTPVFMDRLDLEKSVTYREARNLINPGKIYYKTPYIFVNEKYKGVHIINNKDPYHPVNEGFISAPGCLDIAVKDEIIYLDNAVDLVAFDLLKKQEVDRIVNVFPEPSAPDLQYHQVSDRPEGFVIVEWKKTGSSNH
ncbi:MAG: hypothetical protein LBU57_00465 [Dysgonamonadaceae bacterium]|jgi:glutaredoxin|nr:hypothetical protein [Dysgonamonadaceae bacterium]